MADRIEDVKARFAAEGVSIAEWSRAQGFNQTTVYRLLAGKIRGIRGEAHKIAVALGLKSEPKDLRFRSAEDEAA